MIELGYGHCETAFNTKDGWNKSLEDSPFRLFHRLRHSSEEVNGNIDQEELLGSRGPREVVFHSQIARYLYDIIKKNVGIRHSLTSLLPTDVKDSHLSFAGRDFIRRQARCQSCEPEVKRPEVVNTATLSLLLERSNCRRRLISPSRKHISLSDSEICYTRERKETSADDIESVDDIIVSGGEISAEGVTQLDAETLAEQPATIEISLEDESAEDENGGTFMIFVPSPDSDTTPVKSTESEIPNTAKKRVRFTDEIGEDLFTERKISDTYVPPTLHVDRLLLTGDDFQDLSDFEDCLPGVTRLKSLGPKHSSMPDIIRLPPPVPESRYHHKLGSSDSLYTVNNYSHTFHATPQEGTGRWRLTFAQPAAQYLAFRQRLESNFVSLENFSTSNTKQAEYKLCFYGTIKVKNITFVKHVQLRVTCDKWATHTDYAAAHKLTNISGNTETLPYDTFTFSLTIDLTKMRPPREMQFAVRFLAGEGDDCREYWDNNDGCNYVVVEDTPPTARLNKGRDFWEPALSGTRLCGPERSPVGGVAGPGGGSLVASSPPVSSYTADYRPNFGAFSSLTCYSSWQHYSSESMYY